MSDHSLTPENKAPRLALQAERQRQADAIEARHFQQSFWSARRATIEAVRPIARTVLSPILAYSRTAQKKVQRPSPKQVIYTARKDRPLVLHLLANFEIGGTPQLVCDIIEYTQNDFRHLVVSKHVPHPAPYSGIDLLDIPRPLRDGRLAKTIREYSPAIVHVHYWNGMIEDYVWYHSAFKTLAEAGIPVVENVNTSGEPYFSDIVSNYVFCSDWSREASGAAWIPAKVIYPGTRLSDFTRRDLATVPDDKIGMVYRLHGDKIGPNAIEVFIKVAKAIPTIQSIIVGDGDLVDHFKSRVLAEGVSARFSFPGWVSYARLQQIYREIALFIAPVKDDTFGSVSVYAMCVGIPVVGFDVGGIPEIVGSPDLLAPPGDVQRLADIAIDLLNDRARRLAIGADNQRRAAETFSVEAMSSSFGRLYASLIG